MHTIIESIVRAKFLNLETICLEYLTKFSHKADRLTEEK